MKHLIAFLLIFSFHTTASWKQKRNEIRLSNQKAAVAINKAKDNLKKANAASNSKEKTLFANRARKSNQTAIENIKTASRIAHEAFQTANAHIKYARSQMKRLSEMKINVTDTEDKTAIEIALKENGTILRDNRNLLRAIRENRKKNQRKQETSSFYFTANFPLPKSLGPTKKTTTSFNPQIRLLYVDRNHLTS